MEDFLRWLDLSTLKLRVDLTGDEASSLLMLDLLEPDLYDSNMAA